MKKQSLSTSHGSDAFTLVELLAVIGILGILMSLMVPTVSFVREHAKSTQCVNNLRQWGLAMVAYLDEKQGVFPTDGTDGGAGTPSAQKPDAWYNVLPPYLNGVDTMAALVSKNQAPIPGKGKSFFLCPSSRDDPGYSDSSFFSSYALNHWINAEKGKGFTKRLRLTQIHNPSVFVVMSESPDGRTASVHPSTMIGEGGFTGFRHRGSANALFADGRVASIPQKIGWHEGMALTDNAGDFQWNPQDEVIQ